MNYLDVVIIAFLAYWTLITVAGSTLKLLLFCYKADPRWMSPLKPYHDKVLSWYSTIKSYDVLNLIAHWIFFSNEGGWFDMHIYVRGLRTDCTFTAWHDVTPKGRAGAVHLVYASRREFRAVRKAAVAIISEPDRLPNSAEESGTSNRIIRRARYQFVLQYVRLHISDPAVERCQFLIATPKADMPSKATTIPADFTVPNRHVLLVSPFHILNPDQAPKPRPDLARTRGDHAMHDNTPFEKRVVASRLAY